MRTFQVEYMTRPDEVDHIESFDDFRQACKRAKEMSDKHDGSSVVVALDPMPNGEKGLMSSGHIEFVFGVARERVGTLEKVAIPQ